MYNHFSSRAALIDAVLSDAVRRHGMDRLAERSQDLHWREALTATIATCATFWGSEQALLRRLFAVGTDERDLIEGLRRRERWRADQFAALLAPVVPPETQVDVVGVAVALTSFATYDQLITQTGDPATAERAMQLAVTACLELAAR